MIKIITNSEKETFEFAKKYSSKLNGGEIIGLIGNLGAGKTIFTKGLASGLKIKNTITSPTFILMKVYEIENQKILSKTKQHLTKKIKTFIHIDAYRLEKIKDLKTIGAEEYFNKTDTITIIEWANNIKEKLPKKTIFITIKNIEKNKREIKMPSIKN